jgi:hypothetical protein
VEDELEQRREQERRSVEEAGGGEAEGFEQAEEELIEHAENTSGEGTPRLDELGEEAEADPARNGEPDEEDVTGVVEGPGEGPDDPGRGPGLASER